jgi:hypothetical protein
MTHDRDLERLLSHWLGDGPTEVPDRVIDVVADRIGRQSQRPAWRFPRRELHMTTYPRIAAGLAAVAIVAIGGIYLFGQPSGSGIGGPAATASPSPSPVSTPTASSTLLSSFTFKPRVTVEAPAGWTVDGDDSRTFGLKPPEASGPGAGSILLMSGPFVSASDRDCEDRRAAGVGESAAEVLSALAGDPRIVSTAAGAVNVGGRTAQAVDIKVAAGWTGTCAWSEGKPAVLLVMATDQGPAYGTAGAEYARVILLDLGGEALAMIVSPAAGDTGTDSIDQAMPIVEAIQFMP